MAATKPAGVLMQVIAVMVFLWGMVQTNGAMHPGRPVDTGGLVFGLVLIVGAAALLVAGRKPAVKRID